jgi:hypothetical protein
VLLIEGIGVKIGILMDENIFIYPFFHSRRQFPIQGIEGFNEITHKG